MSNKPPSFPLDMNALLNRYPPGGKVLHPPKTAQIRAESSKTKRPTKTVSPTIPKMTFAQLIDLYPIEAKKEPIDLRIARNQPRNHLMVERTLDLHGDTQKEAEYAVEQFLKRCFAEHVRCVRIIHGKGKHSKTGTAVLKDYLQIALERHPLVLKTTPAGFHDGQGGATIVTLKTNHH